MDEKMDAERAALERAWKEYIFTDVRQCAEYFWQARASLPEGVPVGVPVPGLAEAPSRVEAVIVAIRDLWDEDECPSYPVVAEVLRGWLSAPAAPTVKAEQVGMADAYVGAREDLAIWKRRALEAEQKIRHQEQIIDQLTLEAQGETRFGEPSIPSAEPVAVIEYAGYDPANSIKWLNKGLQYMQPGTLLYTQAPSLPAAGSDGSAMEEVEVVAWSLRLPDGRTTLEKAYPKWAEGEGDGYAIQPLYASPPPAQDTGGRPVVLATMYRDADGSPGCRFVGDPEMRIRDGDALMAVTQHDQDVSGLVEALERARLFIRNGIELGCIKMPDADTPDPAHETLPKIDAALAAHSNANQ